MDCLALFLVRSLGADISAFLSNVYSKKINRLFPENTLANYLVNVGSNIGVNGLLDVVILANTGLL